MIEQYKNLCVLKAFNVGDELLKKCCEAAKSKGIVIECLTEFLDSKILVKNESASEVEYQKLLDKLNEMLTGKVYSDAGKTLEEMLVESAFERGIKIAVAESITGGMICSKIVNVPGSSGVLKEGFITYANEAKVKRLHVKLSILENYGAVSKQTADAMLSSVLENKDITFGIVTTGCAGPASDDFGTPIGQVFIGFGDRKDMKINEYKFCGQRNEIRESVANTALYEAMKYCLKCNKE